MDNDLSITEIRFIRSLLSVKTDAQLAELLEKPVALVTEQISTMSGIVKRPQIKYNDNKRNFRKPIKKQPVFKRRSENVVFATKKIDLSDKIPVRLNAKTTAYVKTGTDIEKLKQLLKIK